MQKRHQSWHLLLVALQPIRAPKIKRLPLASDLFNLQVFDAEKSFHPVGVRSGRRRSSSANPLVLLTYSTNLTHHTLWPNSHSKNSAANTTASFRLAKSAPTSLGKCRTSATRSSQIRRATKRSQQPLTSRGSWSPQSITWRAV